jgi:uncharacterized protein YdhG (YjbR/CyaY superfamily)
VVWGLEFNWLWHTLTSMKSKEVDSYLGGLGADRQAALTRLRSLVFEVAPDAAETMQYRMPTYHYRHEMLCAFASQKHYISLYMNTRLVEKYRKSLQGLDIGKSCIRFRRMEQLPLGIIRKMLVESVRNLLG